MTIRRATEADLPLLSDLCVRSKAVWGYDPDFIEACRGELTLRPEELRTSSVALACHEGAIVAMAQVAVAGDTGDLLKLFVDPGALRSGFGAAMFAWAAAEARRLGAVRMTIESDPGAVPFYRRMGAEVVGSVPSGSIAGRRIPLLSLALGRDFPVRRKISRIRSGRSG